MLRLCVRSAIGCRATGYLASCSRQPLVRALATTTTTTSEPERVAADVDVSALPKAQRRFVQEMQRVNEQRVNKIHRRNKKSHVMFAGIVLLVISIYCYTIYAVKQETFLQEIDEEMAQEDAKKTLVLK